MIARLVAAVLAALAAGSARAQGLDVYRTHCAICHQAGGVGAPGAFPRLAGRVGPLARDPGGRALLTAVVLNGMSGKLEADGQTIVGLMPSFGQLPDADIAAVLNYLAGLGPRPPAPFTDAEVAAARAKGRLTPVEVNQLARSLTIKGAP